jgi:hypothetical protein
VSGEFAVEFNDPRDELNELGDIITPERDFKILGGNPLGGHDAHP